MARLNYRQGPYGAAGSCRVDLYCHEGTIVAVVTEMADNPGPSITNAAEAIHAELQRRCGPEVVHVEHYGPMSYEGAANDPDRWSTVTLDERGSATWVPIAAGELAALTGVTTRELRAAGTPAGR